MPFDEVSHDLGSVDESCSLPGLQAQLLEIQSRREFGPMNIRVYDSRFTAAAGVAAASSLVLGRVLAAAAYWTLVRYFAKGGASSGLTGPGAATVMKIKSA